MPERFNLAFAGGGAKGAAFIGALDVLRRGQHRTHRLLGTSAGAITAMALAAGYSPEEMLDILVLKKGPDKGKPCFVAFLEPPTADDFPPDNRSRSELAKVINLILDGALNTKHLKNKLVLAASLRLVANELNRPILLDALMNVPLFVQFYSLLEVGAGFSDRKLVAWIKEQLRNKKFAEEITLEEFHKATRQDLSLVAVDTTARELLVLNQRTAPKCPVWAAVRMSMSLPFIWQEVSWKESWGAYRGREMSKARIIDGGTLSNFPMRLFVDAKSEEIREMMGAPDPGEVRNLGLYLDERRPAPDAEEKASVWNLKVAERAARIIETSSGPWDQEIVERYAEDICFIGTKGFGVLEFDMDDKRLQALVNSGRCAMTEFLKKRKFSLP